MTEFEETVLLELVVNDEDVFSESQQMILAIAQRVAAGFSFICALYMAKIAFAYRDRVYHRLMFGLACHLLLYTVWSLYGTAAVPEGTPDAFVARGTSATCSLQGFGKQVSFALPFYYVFLSLYSYFAVINNFDVSKYLWIEKWIHVFVNVVPTASAVYLLSIDAFNFTGHVDCWIGSIPFGCGDDSGIECERGPQNITAIAGLFAGLPSFFVLVFPSCVMAALYFAVRRKQDSVHLEAATVAKQAGLYLVALYWSYIFAMINSGIQWVANKKNFTTALISVVNLNLQGFWFLLIYLHFRVSGKSTGKSTVASESRENEDSLGRLSAQSSQPDARPTFNIFDGSNAGGAFAQYVFDGDSDDEIADIKETAQWSSVQNHI